MLANITLTVHRQVDGGLFVMVAQESILFLPVRLSLAYIIQRIEGFLYHLVAQIMQEIPESNRTKPKTKFQPFHKTTS